jgi:HK97 family phage portal protein
MNVFGFNITRQKKLPLPQPRSAYSMGSNANFELNTSFAELVKQGLYSNAVVQGCISAYTMTLNEPEIEIYIDEVETEEHPLCQLFEHPNKAMSRAQLLSFIAAYVAIGGNAYVVKVRNQMGATIALYPYHDGQIKPVPSQYEWIDHYEYKVDNVTTVIPASDVIHFRSHIIDPQKPHLGMSPILAAARGVDIYSEMEKIVYSTLKNDGMPRGLLSFPVEAAMSPQQVDLIREQFGEQYGGSKRGRTAVLSGGASYERISFNLEELQADNIISRAEVAICQAFRVHPLVAMTYAGLMNSTYSNMEEAFKQFTTLTRVPIWKSWQDTLMQGFATEYPGVVIEFDIDDVEALKPAQSEVETAVVTQFTSNVITQNEARYELGYEPIIGADKFMYELTPPMPGMTTEPLVPALIPEEPVEPIEPVSEDGLTPDEPFPFFDGEVTHDYLGKEMSAGGDQVEWKRQDAVYEQFARRVARDFAKVAAELETEVLKSTKGMAGLQVKADPFNFSVWTRRFIDGTKRSFNALVRAVVGDSLAQVGATGDEFGATNFEAVVRTATAESAQMITESVGTIRDELQTLITQNANTTAEELTKVIKSKFSVIKDSRAAMIGRTTVTATAGKTHVETWKKRNTQIEDPAKKIVPVWTTENDGAVRGAHSAINRTGPNEQGYWSLAGAQVRYPGDPAAPAAQTCNCRCTLFPTRVGRI